MLYTYPSGILASTTGKDRRDCDLRRLAREVVAGAKADQRKDRGDVVFVTCGMNTC